MAIPDRWLEPSPPLAVDELRRPRVLKKDQPATLDFGQLASLEDSPFVDEVPAQAPREAPSG
jgi:hypothetical protein